MKDIYVRKLVELDTIEKFKWTSRENFKSMFLLGNFIEIQKDEKYLGYFKDRNYSKDVEAGDFIKYREHDYKITYVELVKFKGTLIKKIAMEVLNNEIQN